MIWLALALAVWAGAFAYAIHRWSVVELSRQETTRTISNNVRATSERIDGALSGLRATFAGMPDVQSITPPARPHFGQKPTVAVDNDKPDPAA